jgi:hypothetical protein
LTTRETVAIETPARSAISRIVTREGRCATSVTGIVKQFPELSGNSLRCEQLRRPGAALDFVASGW